MSSDPTPEIAPERAYEIARTDGEGAHTLFLRGTFRFADAPAVWAETRAVVHDTTAGALDFDLSAVTAIDGATMALLVATRSELKARGVECELVGAQGPALALVHLYRGDVDPSPRKRRRPESSLAQVGRVTLEFIDGVRNVMSFFGDMVLAVLGYLKEPKTGNWKDVPRLMEKAGADAVPIVVLINFLVGFVMAFQGAAQLKQFGANIFVADLVGIAITRELGPLMTAIIVCGRSGASFAAELGTMKVSEEIDALRTLGFGPIRYLVLPRALALILVVPILTLLGDVVGIAGGLLVAKFSLDVTFEAYMNETKKALDLWSVGSGLLKSVAFALAIALVSCQQGFATTGGAEGVGRRTTSSVVSILFALILIDAAFTVFLFYFHL